MGSFSLTHWVILAIIGFGIYSIVKSNARPTGQSMHCMTCGVDAPPKTSTSGSIGIEIVLWLCFIVPGLIYSIWRLSSRKSVCSSCGAQTIIPMDSPAAVTHRRTLAS